MIKIIKLVVITVVTSFIFDIFWNMQLKKKPDLFLPIQQKIPKTKIRYLYNFIFYMIPAILIVLLKVFYNINDIIIAILLGFLLSLIGIIFNNPKTKKQTNS